MNLCFNFNREKMVQSTKTFTNSSALELGVDILVCEMLA